MKKKILLLFLTIVSIALSSCNDTRIIDIDNVTWKNKDFNIVSTSTQLQNQGNDPDLYSEDDYYSTITVLNVKYSCEIHIANGFFGLTLYNPLNTSVIYFYGKSREFLWGHYSNGDFNKIKDKEYRYTLTILLDETGQYYEYCMENNMIFPTTITLYGYENK